MMKSRLFDRISRLFLISVLAGNPVAQAADRWWDGPSAGGPGDGASAGGNANWDASTANWDQGSGLARVAWSNSGYDTANFGGSSNSTVTLVANITAAKLSVASKTYIIRGNQTLTLATAATPSGAIPTIFNSTTLTLGGSGLTTDVAGTEGLLKVGGGSLFIRGTTALSLTGGLVIDAAAYPPTSSDARVEVDFSDMASNSSNLLNSTNSLTITSGSFSVKGRNGGGNLSQTLNGLTLTGGQAGLWVNHNSSTNTTLDVGTITRNGNAGFHVNVSSATAALAKGTHALTHGIIGTWASHQFNSVTNSYATLDGSGNIVAYSGGTSIADASGLTAGGSTTNYDLGAATGTMDTAASAHTLRYTGGAATTMVVGTLTANGLMNAGSGAWTIHGGAITIGADQELVINTANGFNTTDSNNITVGSNIQESSAGAKLTITGYKQVTLTGDSSYSGTTTINGNSAFSDGGFTVKIAALKDIGKTSQFGTGSLLVLNGAVVRTGATESSDRDISITGPCGFYVKGAFTQTLTGSISGSGTLISDGDYNSGIAGGTGNLILAGDNSFTGDMRVMSDARITLAHANALKNATLDISGDRSLVDLNTHNLPCNIGGLKGTANLNLGRGTGNGGNGRVTIGSNHQSTTYTGVLSGMATLVKSGTGTLALTGINTYSGETVVEDGILAVNGSALPDTTRLVIHSGKVAASGEELVDSLLFGTVMQAAGTWGATGSGAENLDDTHFTGSAGVIRVQPLGVSPASLDFAHVPVDSSITLDVTITNLGKTVVSGSASTTGAPYSVSPSSWSVAPSSSAVLQISFLPTEFQTYTGVLTLVGNGLTRTVQLAGDGGTLGVPDSSLFSSYQCAGLSGMPGPGTSGGFAVSQGASFTQSFIPRRDAFLTAYAARDTAAPSTSRLGGISIRTSSYTNSPSTLRFELFRVESDASRTSIYTEDFQRTPFGNTTYKFNPTHPPVMNYDQSHELKVTLVTAGNPAYGGPSNLTFSRTTTDYAEGSANVGGDIWCNLEVIASLPIYSGFSSTAGTGSRFFLDSDPLNANSTSYDSLPGKLLGTWNEAEPVTFIHPAIWEPLTFEIDSPSLATGSITGSTSTSKTFTMRGHAEGKGMLWIRSGSVVVSWMKLQAYPRRSMRLSYSYVQYPGESDHSLKTMGPDVMAYISSVYDKANVGIHWTDNEIITHEWDLNGDGNSFSESYTETWSPLDSGAIPNPLDVFSNLYTLRYDKDDSTTRGGGGGTSRGFGQVPPPANGGNVRATLNRSAVSLGSTLAHELGHNLGLPHTDITNNLMDVGRAKDALWAPQWDVVHATLAMLPPDAVDPDENNNGLPDDWEDFWFGNHDEGANPPNEDPDHDGLPTLIEFVTGTNPTAFNPNPLTQSFVNDSEIDYLQLSVPRNPDAADYIFVIEFSADFETWTPGVVTASGPNFVARDTVPIGTAPGRCFGRLRVISPNP